MRQRKQKKREGLRKVRGQTRAAAEQAAKIAHAAQVMADRAREATEFEMRVAEGFRAAAETARLWQDETIRAIDEQRRCNMEMLNAARELFDQASLIQQRAEEALVKAENAFAAYKSEHVDHTWFDTRQTDGASSVPFGASDGSPAS